MESVVMFDAIKSGYANKKVFMTGHTGFKGAWLTLILEGLGAEVKGYSLEPEEVSLYNVIDGNSHCNSIIANILDKDRMQKEILDFEPDYVFHLAAQAIVRESYTFPVETFEVNTIGTANILDALRNLDKQCAVIIVSTDKVYENLEIDYAYKEYDKLGGFDPYSSSKACTEIVTNSYRLSFFNPADYDHHGKSISSGRAGNVIGGGDWAKDRIVPDLVRALENGDPLKVRNPQALRPWQHVFEPLGGYLLLGAKLSENPVLYAEGYNFGPEADDELKVEELVKVALEYWGEGTYEPAPNPNDPHEANLLKLDINKAKETLGWAPQLRSKEAIGLTVDWYKNYKEDPVNYCNKQIREYFKL
ncbi:CDP-glucose 4,6-dehydratase [bacterium AH-315-C07]|nr:CDP-glucose 4,6-dehydratase [bacterium AH-315-C07]